MSHYHIAYRRVSSTDQNTDRQLAEDGITFDTTYTDKCSGGSAERPELHRMLEGLRKGDTIHVHSIDRLARNLQDLQELVKVVNGKGATLRFHKEQLTFSPDENSAMSKLLLQVMGAFAEFERALIRERQAEGIAKAKEADRTKPRGERAYQGRKPTFSKDQIMKAMERNEGNKSAAARELGISYRTVLRVAQG